MRRCWRVCEDPPVQPAEFQVDSDAQPGQPGKRKEGSDVAGATSVPPDQRQDTPETVSKRQR